MSNILSVNFTHDASLCYLENGEIKLYLKEERYSKKKRDCVPFKCLNEFKNLYGNEKIDTIIVCDYNATPDSISIYQHYFSKVFGLVDPKKFFAISNCHHIFHAALAFYNSGFDECLSIVVDGAGSAMDDGSLECETAYISTYPNKFVEIIKNTFSPSYRRYKEVNHDGNLYNQESLFFWNGSGIKKSKRYNGSIGGLVNIYSGLSLLMGQTIYDNGKGMGLSSYGKSIDGFPKIIDKTTQSVDQDLFVLDSFEHYKNIPMPVHKNYSQKVASEITKENYKMYADYAYEIQTQTQESVGDIIEESIKRTNIKKVCISGGYGMNIVANHYYLQRFPDVKFYFEPISDDSGISIGAAKFLYHSQTKDKTKRTLSTTSFHGTLHDVSNYRGITTTIKEIASLLYENKSVAVYTGLSEAGQRALGNRSILFNPLNPDAKDIVNRIKKREWYRPFAAMVLEEDANIYFNMERIKSSPFMTICFPVKQEYTKLLPGVTHVDNTCRIQTISKENKYLYELLIEYKKISDHGILLNTSFNLAGEPLVETPEDAFKTLNNSCLDYLWFEETKQLFEKI